MQHTAWIFASIYISLNAVLTVLLKFCGLTWFDALCHAFGTMATGGFSTYNASLGHFDSALIEGIVILFMLLAGMNFTLLYFLLLGQPLKILTDLEWRTYIGIIGVAAIVIIAVGYFRGEFIDQSGQPSWLSSVRYGLFQVVSIITTTGYGTHDFDGWNDLGRCILLVLMFVGGCSGSTGGGVKVIRWVLLFKIIGLELEKSHRPRVIRPLRIGGKAIEDGGLQRSILLYFALIGLIFMISWLFVVGFEPDSTWAGDTQHKLVDSASAVAATLNNIGPGLGTVGATQNYGHFSAASKLLFTWLMMLGRVELFAILVLFLPAFWRSR
jgi:trk system potassium uptake protein TrkH